MKDENLNLHIRAQNGHGYVTPVRIKDAEVSPNDLPNEFTHCSLRVNLADILLRGVEAKSGQYVHLIDRVPAPGECIPGMRGECDVTIFIDTKFAASLGVKFYRAENRMFMARTEREFHRPKGIRPTAIKKYVIIYWARGLIQPNQGSILLYPNGDEEHEAQCFIKSQQHPLHCHL